MKLVLNKIKSILFGKIKEISLNLLIMYQQKLKETLQYKKVGGLVLTNNGKIYSCHILMFLFTKKYK